MNTGLLRAFQVLDRTATMEDVLDARRQLFIESDEYNVSLRHPFDSSEVDGVANAILEYILNPGDPIVKSYSVFRRRSRRTLHRILRVCGDVFGRYVVSELFERICIARSRGFPGTLKTFLVGILFRYQFCVDEDLAAFPVSVILDYMDAVRILLLREQRESDLSDALWTTLERSFDRLNRDTEWRRTYPSPKSHPPRIGGHNTDYGKVGNE